MIKVALLIETLGTEKFKSFLSQPFDFTTIDIYFDGWRSKNMGTWVKYTNDDKIVIEKYPTYYRIINNNNQSQLLLPISINDFINDMHRNSVQLYWTDWIDDNFEPKDYLKVDEIKDYFTKLLIRMGKSHELN